MRLHFAYGRGACRFHRAGVAGRGGWPRARLLPRARARASRASLGPAAGRLAGCWRRGCRDHGRLRPGGRAMAVERRGRAPRPVVGSGRRHRAPGRHDAAVRRTRRGGLRHRRLLLDGAGAMGDALVAEGRAVRLGCAAGWDRRARAPGAARAPAAAPGGRHLHTHALAAHVVLGAALPRALTRLHRAVPPRPHARRASSGLLYRLLRARYARLVALSPAMAAAMIARAPRPGAVTVVPNPVDVAPGATSPPRPAGDRPRRRRGPARAAEARRPPARRGGGAAPARAPRAAALVVGGGASPATSPERRAATRPRGRGRPGGGAGSTWYRGSTAWTSSS